MNLTDKNQIKYLCQKYGLRPSRESGQNFLVDKKVLQQIVAAANLKSSDIVLEVGPGFGVLTQELARRVEKVIAVEIDKRLVAALRETMAGFDNVEIVRGDVLKLNIGRSDLQQQVVGDRISDIVASLPYNITSRFLRRFIGDSRSNRTDRTYMTLMLQKEVAERICAKPGKMSVLSVSVQFYAKPEIMTVVAKKNFWPEPEVDSAIINIRPRDKYLKMLDLSVGDITPTDSSEKVFFQLVKIGFSARRKQLQNNLSAGLKVENKKVKAVLVGLGLNPLARAQELSVEQWVALYRHMSSRPRSREAGRGGGLPGSRQGSHSLQVDKVITVSRGIPRSPCGTDISPLKTKSVALKNVSQNIHSG